MQLITTDLLPSDRDDQKARFAKTMPLFKLAYQAVLAIQKDRALQSREGMSYSYEVLRRAPFKCDLTCSRCVAETAAGVRCKRKVCVGIPVCAQHGVMYFQVSVGRTKLTDKNGKRLDFAGLFACGGAKRGVVFETGGYIVPYLGELVTREEVDRRYDFPKGSGKKRAIAPFAQEQNTGVGTSRIYDAACYRSYGAFINTTSDAPGYANRMVGGAKAVANCRFEYHHEVEPEEAGHRDARRFPGLTATRDIRHNEEILVIGQPNNTLKKRLKGDDVYPLIDTSLVTQTLHGYTVPEDACEHVHF